MIYALSRRLAALAEEHPVLKVKQNEIQRSGRENEETVSDPHRGFRPRRSQGAVPGSLAAQTCPDPQAASGSQRKFLSFCDRLERRPAVRHAGGLQGRGRILLEN